MTLTDSPQTDRFEELLDECVHCGFCLPTCPTYVLGAEEMDSPRGRIVLMRELHDGGISPELVTHVDRCLSCMACTTACPSGVRYDLLVNEARREIEERTTRSLGERLKRRTIFAMFPHHRRMRALVPLLPFARLGQPFKKTRELARLAPQRPPKVAPIPDWTPAQGESRGRVGFLQGCVQRAYFPHVNRATVEVLAAEGWDVHAPSALQCCGSLELHAGEADRAAKRAKATIEAFAEDPVVITNAAGCGSGMKENDVLGPKVQDVTELLAANEPRARRRPLPLTVPHHAACHLAHAQQVREQPRKVLQQMPGLELLEAEGWEICRGSAGIYNLTQPHAAAELGRAKAHRLLATGAEAIAAANPGCTLQIQAHLRELGRPLPVYHPIELIHRSITGADA